MMIEHNPLFNTDKVIDHYSDKDGVPITYVCTTELDPGNLVPVDVFYRETPHPEFGNRYFGLLNDNKDRILITNADSVEELTFACVEDLEGGLYYSRDRHDCVTLDNGDMIDGGRLYTRTNGCEVFTYTVKDGIMVPFNETEAVNND
jgi:hypothetical protein